MSAALAKSVQTRLVRHAKQIGVDPNLVLARYAAERLLYRLSRSRHADRFVLKGALLLLAWLGGTIRPTRDADLLGIGDLSDEGLAATFVEICGIDVEQDGMIFDDGVTTRLAEDRFLMTTTTGGAARVLSHLERWHQTEWPGGAVRPVGAPRRHRA